jgi:hypothetical protein
MALISVRVALRSYSSWFAAGAEFSPYREKVAEELLLCRSWFNRICLNHYSENQSAAYEVPCSTARNF